MLTEHGIKEDEECLLERYHKIRLHTKGLHE